MPTLPTYPAGGRIAFQTDRDGNEEIYVMGCDGSGQVNLTNNSATDKQPSWSSGGKLAFSSNRNASGGYDIYLLTLSPWGIERLTINAADDESPALSPDGSKVAFVSYRDGNAEIYVLDISAKTLTNITDNTAADKDPAWSPDGTKIAFASKRDGDWDVYIAAADGSGEADNLTDTASNDRWPDFGFYDYGDGTSDTFIAFASDRDGDWEIFTMYDDGTDPTQSTSNMDGTVDAEPSWDSLAEYMVIHSNRDGNLEVATMYFDAADYINLSKSAASSDVSPDWEPVENAGYCGE